MNWDIVRSIIGRILFIIGFIMLLPMLISLYFNEAIEYTLAFLISSVITVSGGYLLSRKKMDISKLHAKEGLVIVSLTWILVSLFGCLPFLLSGASDSFIDAFFEMVSGFTTTGASTIENVEFLPNSMLFWISSTHFMGGMGVLVFALAVLPRASSESVHIMRAEVPGPTFGKIASKLSDSARVLYTIYISLMLVVFVLILLTGVPWFHSLLLAFGVAGTGGFGIINGSIALYDTIPLEIIMGLGMIIFGINFNLFYQVLQKQGYRLLKNEELKWYLSFIVIAVLLITLNLSFNDFPVFNSLRHSFFTVSSIISTTGYYTADFGQWPLFSQLILLALMFTGGMAGSTSGGLKMSRIILLIKSAIAEVKRAFRPNRALPIIFEGEIVKPSALNKVYNYVITYIFIFIFAMLVVSLETPDFLSAFGTVAATINNIGAGLGIVGPTYNYAAFSPLMKLFLCFIMILGRLEIFPVLILFAPNTWKKSI